jgi:hypothetical protein
MVRTMVYVCLVLGGCAAGITFGYTSTRSLLDGLTNTIPANLTDTPAALVQRGVIERVDRQDHTLLLRTTSPYDPAITMPMRINYDNVTTFWDQFGTAISVATILNGDRVQVNIVRQPGALYASRMYKL